MNSNDNNKNISQNLIELPKQTNSLLEKYFKSLLYEGTILALLGGYSSYLIIHRFSRGALLGYAIIAGYNHKLLVDSLKQNY